MNIDTIISLATPVLIAITGGGITLGGKWLMSGQAEIKKDIGEVKDGLDKRVTVLEGDNRQFMPKSDLTTAFEHEKKGRIAADEAAAAIIKDIRAEIVQQGKDIAKLEQADLNHIQQVERFEKRFDRMDTKLDSICDTLSKIAKREA